MQDLRLKLKSAFTVDVTGERPERFLNAAAAKGIYISEARPIEGGLRLRLSRAACRIMEQDLPEGLDMRRVREHGAPRLLRGIKKRYLLMLGAAAAAAAFAGFSSAVWRVEVSGGTPRLRAETEAFLKEKGLVPGTLKRNIDQNAIKREAILSIDDMMWLWVDLKGATAYVRVAARSLPPKKLPTEPANVVARETGVVESITVLDGAAAVGELETVEKGQVLISGLIPSERIEEPIIRHARGAVTARVWREKNVIIPKTREKRTPTGQSRKIRSIKIKKFIVNFSINSSILYPKYDRIRTEYKLGSLPVEFIVDEYAEVKAETETVDVEAEAARVRAEFEKEIADSGAELVNIDEKREDRGGGTELCLTAECLTDIAAETPM